MGLSVSNFIFLATAYLGQVANPLQGSHNLIGVKFQYFSNTKFNIFQAFCELALFIITHFLEKPIHKIYNNIRPQSCLLSCDPPNSKSNNSALQCIFILFNLFKSQKHNINVIYVINFVLFSLVPVHFFN